MDTRLIVTVPVTGYVVVLTLFALAGSTADVAYTEGQPAFLLVVGLFVPLLALGLIWLENYTYGAPLLVAATVLTAYFVGYFFLLHDNPANALSVTGAGAAAYLVSAIGIVAISLILAGMGTWLWYRTSEQFRTAVDRFIRAPPADD